MYYVYVIKNENGEFYYGYTSDLRRRFIEHNNNFCQSTKFHKWKLVYYESYLDKRDAMERERKLKRFGQTFYHLKERLKYSLMRN